MVRLSLVSVIGPVLSVRGEEQIDFGRDIQPILANHCYACHGPGEKVREAGLRLDRRQSAVEHEAVVPGQADDSELIRRILSDESDEQMPPAEFNKPLLEAQKQLLRNWIDQGAEYGRHWAFKPIAKPVPKVVENDWARSELDQFVLKRLQGRGIDPAAETDRECYLRRVTLDLTGLPPTIAELDALLADRSVDAYEKVVERLLQSDDYAERMATIWLDNAAMRTATVFNSTTSGRCGRGVIG